MFRTQEDYHHYQRKQTYYHDKKYIPNYIYKETGREFTMNKENFIL